MWFTQDRAFARHEALERAPSPPTGEFFLGPHLPIHYATQPVTTVYIIAVMTSLNCGVDVLCLRAVEPDSATYVTLDACLAARDRLVAQNDALRELRLECVPKSSALPYAKND